MLEQVKSFLGDSSGTVIEVLIGIGDWSFSCKDYYIIY